MTAKASYSASLMPSSVQDINTSSGSVWADTPSAQTTISTESRSPLASMSRLMEKFGRSGGGPLSFEIASLCNVAGVGTTLNPGGICHSESPAMVTVVPFVETVSAEVPQAAAIMTRIAVAAMFLIPSMAGNPSEMVRDVRSQEMVGSR